MEVNVILQMKSITIGNFTKRDGTASYFLYGLGFDGNVYRYDSREDGWKILSMKAVDIARDLAQEAED